MLLAERIETLTIHLVLGLEVPYVEDYLVLTGKYHTEPHYKYNVWICNILKIMYSYFVI